MFLQTERLASGGRCSAGFSSHLARGAQEDMSFSELPGTMKCTVGNGKVELQF